MKENTKSKLQSRREFFKKAAKAALPVVGAVVIASLPTHLFATNSTSCDGSCAGRCTGGCTGNCTGACYGGCSGKCSGSCKGTSTIS